MPTNTKLSLGVLGTSGLKESGGTILEEFHPKLRGTFGPKVYQEMADNSSIIGAVQYTIDSLVRQVEWRVEAADNEDEQAMNWAMFLEQVLEDMETPLEDFISEILSMLIYGWAYFEVIYKIRRGYKSDETKSSYYDDGKIGWGDIALRAQDTLDKWEFDTKTRALLGMHQVDYYTGRHAFLPLDKCVLFTTRKYKNNPEGRSIYRNAVVDYYYYKRICQIEAIGIERDLAGMPVMQVPLALLNADADANARAIRAELEKMLSEIKNDERAYAIVPTELNNEGAPTGYKLGLLSTGGSRQLDIAATKRQYKTNILQCTLAQFIELGTQNVGSFALASSQTHLFSVALDGILKNISRTINRKLVSRLMDLNGCPVELRPKLVHGDIETPSLEELGQYITALAGAGQLFEDDRIKRRLHEVADLPVPELDEDMDDNDSRLKSPVKGMPSGKNEVVSQTGQPE